MTRPRFGLSISTSTQPDSDPVAAARRAEDLGFDFVSASDHPSGTHPTYETWTMLSWIAAATSRIHVATRVLGVPYRSPAMVAKMAESFDRLSGGRLVLGLGGGASDDEFRAFGLGVRSPREKVDGLAEAVRVVRGLWTQPRLSYAGRAYQIDDAPMEPKPARPIPIWLGTFGPRGIKVTGELADGWIPSLGYVPTDRLVRLRRRMLDAAQEAGRDPRTITSILNLGIRIGPRTDDESEVSGTVEAVTERLLELVAAGFDGFNVSPNGPDAADQAERLAAEVIPQLREQLAPVG